MITSPVRLLCAGVVLASLAAAATSEAGSIHTLTFSSPLNAYVAAITSSDAHSVTSPGAHAHVDAAALERVKHCMREHIQPDSPIMQASERVPASQLKRVHAREHMVMQTLLHTYPHVCALTRCLLRANVTHASLLTQSGPKLLYAAMGSVGTCSADDSLGLVRTLLDIGPMFAFHMRLRNRTRDAVAVIEDADAYNLLHKALDRDKLLLQDMASRVLQPRAATVRGGKTAVGAANVLARQQREYDDMLAVIVRTLAAEASESTRVRIQAALQHLTHANIRGRDKSVVLGRSVAAADVQALCNALSVHTLHAVMSAMRTHEADVNDSSNATDVRSLLRRMPQPRLSQLLCERDKYGRTPLHMAAVTNNDEAVRVIQDEVVQLVAQDARHTCALFTRDVWGYTPRQLAEATSATRAAAAIAAAELSVASTAGSGATVESLQAAADERDGHRIPMRHARPLQRILQRSHLNSTLVPLDDVFINDTRVSSENGGWTAARWIAPRTRAALQAAWDAGAAARDCDFDVLQPHELTPQTFLRDYFLPGRPVAIRGLMQAWRERASFTRQKLLTAHGKVNFTAGDIPYARVFGQEDTTLTLAQYVLAALTCDPVTRRLQVDDEALESMLASTRTSVTHSLCEGFIPVNASDGVASVDATGSVHQTTSSKKAAGAYDASTGRTYIFNTLDPSSPLSRRLAGDMRLLPDFLNITIPLWNAGDDEVDLEHIVVDTSIAPQFYVGPAGTGAPMHYHEDAWNALMFGEKRWFMQRPAHARYSTVPIIDYVVEELPRLRDRIASATAEGRADSVDPEPLQCTQLAGDAVYVPRGWGHAVLNMRTSVGYAVEFATSLERY